MPPQTRAWIYTFVFFGISHVFLFKMIVKNSAHTFVPIPRNNKQLCVWQVF